MQNPKMDKIVFSSKKISIYIFQNMSKKTFLSISENQHFSIIFLCNSKQHACQQILFVCIKKRMNICAVSHPNVKIQQNMSILRMSTIYIVVYQTISCHNITKNMMMRTSNFLHFLVTKNRTNFQHIWWISCFITRKEDIMFHINKHLCRRCTYFWRTRTSFLLKKWMCADYWCFKMHGCGFLKNIWNVLISHMQ